MKVGRNLPRLRALLDQLGLTPHARYTSYASLPDQQVMPLADAPEEAPIFR